MSVIPELLWLLHWVDEKGIGPEYDLVDIDLKGMDP